VTRLPPRGISDGRFQKPRAITIDKNDHLYIVDPRGDWMMRMPVDPDPARLKRDLDRLLRASAGWDRAGR